MFFLLAVASLLGGTWHGWHRHLLPSADYLLWRATVWSIMLAAWCLLRATGGERLRRASLLLVAVGIVLSLFTGAFVVAIVVYAPALVVAFLRADALGRGATAVRAAVVTSVVAAVVQRSSLNVGMLNHNDLYHAVQLAGNALFFVAARRASARSD